MTDIKVPDLGGATMNAVDVEADDFIHPYFFLKPEEQKRIFDSVPHFSFRDDDVMLCAFPKNGTHWLFEILTMLVHKTSKVVEESSKIKTMLEGYLANGVDDQPSPRVINSHYPPRYLPLKGLADKQIKTVVIFRNPKDTAVSYYNHMHGLKVYDYNGNWQDWLPVYLEGKCESGKYSNYLSQWEQIIENGPGFPLHVMYYEDLKLNGPAEMDKVAKFLGVELDDKLKGEILKSCGFETMAERSVKEKVHEGLLKEDFQFFRKGEIGDWKNWFTEEQNKTFDEIWGKEMKDSNMFKFTYTS